VDDLARAHILALEALTGQAFDFEVFNLGNGSGFSNLEVVEAARKVTGNEISITFGPRREGDAAILVANSTKARDLLGWHPQVTDLEDIVQSAWEWHRFHPQGYLTGS